MTELSKHEIVGDPRRIRALVFDMDGTLVDSYLPIAESLNHARAAHGLPPVPVEEVRRGVGHGLEALISRFVGSDAVEEGVRSFRERYSSVFAKGTVALPDVPRTLREIHRRGFRLALASNKPSYFAGPILESLGLRNLFLSVHGPDTAGAAKPHPAMIHACLDALGASPAEAVYVGDMVLDVESAREAGVGVVLVAGGSSAPDALRDTGERLLHRFADLLDLLPPRPLPAPDPQAGRMQHRS